MLRGLDLTSNFSFGTLGSHKALSLPPIDATESSSISAIPNGSSTSLQSISGIGSGLDFNQKFSLKEKDPQGSSLQKVKVHNLLNDARAPTEFQQEEKTKDSSDVNTLLTMATLASQVTPMKPPQVQIYVPKPQEFTSLPPLSSFDLPMPFKPVQQMQSHHQLPVMTASFPSVLPSVIANAFNSSQVNNLQNLPTFQTSDVNIMLTNLPGNQKQWWQSNASQLKQIHNESSQLLKPMVPQFKQQKPPSKSNRGIFDTHWKQHFNQLREFKKINGHTNVTRTTDQWRNLGNWVAEQRRKMRKGKLTRVQFQLLQSIGFEWDRSYYFKPNSGNCFEGLTADELREIEEITGSNPL